MTSKKTLILAAMAAAALIAPAAQAASAADGKTLMERVSYADLDLSKAGDARVLLHRIRQTGETAIEAIERFDECYNGATASAVAAVGAPSLTEALRNEKRNPLGVSVQASR
ncbi:UrcA family protein [Caulobacter ginsengisoli]|uniref:UrcA family protein n=1 Tax=Caulobacter ginsengisoli TaxID=400775 RepID=A0ABU0IPJ8_9CAUL|nr:UrcA family protein [Caulobacter ginsengisoli]MDQ0463927.1 UrcA family protein [Caulobacter ginsengisoli]